MNHKGGDAQPTMGADMERIMAEFSAMKHDISELMTHAKADVSRKADSLGTAAGERIDQLGSGTRRVIESLEAQGSRSAKALARQIEERPVISLLIAFGIGMVASRLAAR